MKLLVLGGGGREHALVWRLRQGESVSKIWCSPGNGGIADEAECVAADAKNVAALADLAARLGADLTVVGPEEPLVLGIADEFARRGQRLLGPTKRCAQLEGSKIFAKEFLEQHGIATARALGVYDSADAARAGVHKVPGAMVLKADGLCAGKGVLVTSSAAEAEAFVERAMERREFGEGGARLLVEEALAGQELSFIVLADGENFLPMVPTRDHKRVFDGDRGPNTGGMGAYSTDGMIAPELERQITETIVRPTLAGLAKDVEPYRGFLYFGLMLTPNGPKVLEFNCRLGDPEAQAIMARVDGDLGGVLAACAVGELRRASLRWKPGASLCVVMTSGGYPGAFETGKEIEGLAEAGAMPNVAVFHAGTSKESDIYYTRSGRVLGVTASGSDVRQAREAAYAAVAKIHFTGAHYRRDIAETAGVLTPVGRS